MALTEVIARYWRTIRWLRVSQLGWFVIRRMLPGFAPRKIRLESHRAPMRVQHYPVIVQPDAPEFRFIGISRPADVPVDWHPQDLPRLWRYNLHYFDFLLWDSLPDNQKKAIIEDWIAANPAGSADAWEPYTVSLRIVNWIKFFDALADPVPKGWLESLINQANWLMANIEYHILANHFLKNGKALLYAGAYFEGRAGGHFLNKGVEIFGQEVEEQVLGDGGHYERSLMYHSIVVEDLLDVANLTKAQPKIFTKGFKEIILRQAELTTRFLEDMVAGDGCIPLFNDSAFDIAPEAEELIAYAQRLLGYKREPCPPTPVAISKQDSGYYGYRAEGEGLIIDCGEVAPDYQPGHAHCDLLSFEFCLHGRRVIVDSGTYGYETDEHRSYLRSTSAHNTLVINGAEQSEVWGGFRMGRRARPVFARIEEFDLSGMRFVGAHSGFAHLRQQVQHERHVDVDFGKQWVISDVLTGNGDCIAESYLHFAPGLTPREQPSGVWLVFEEDVVILEIKLLGGCEATSSITDYFPRFGVIEDKYTLRITRSGALPLEFGYRLIRC